MGFIKPNNNSGGSGGGLTPQELSRLNNAYTHSKSEHAPTTAEQNVQPDWNETDTTSDAYIKNKPDLSQIGSGGNTPSVAHIEPEELDMPKVFFYGNALPTAKDNVNLTMDYISNTAKFSSFVKLKCQGTSSMSYAKKNFTITMFSDEARATKLKKDFKGWGAQSKFCLKANYVDTTHTRNISGARIAYDMVASRPDSPFKQQLLQCPRNGAVDGFPIKLYFNGEFYGIYTWNIPKDAWMFNMDKNNPNHCVLCAEKNTDGNANLINSCQFRQLWTNGDGNDWSVEVGTYSTDMVASFNRCINFVMTATDQEFHDNIGQYFDLYSLLDYYCFSYFVNHLDGLAKNMLMATYDGVIWGASLYDMDSIYGVSWNGGSFVSPQYQCPEQYQEQFSALWPRIERCFATELYARYLELRQGALSLSNIVKHVEEIYDVIPDRVLADEKAKWTSLPNVSTNTMTRFRNYMRDRAVYVDAQMQEIGTKVPCTGIVLSTDTLSFTTTDTQTLSVVVSPTNCTDTVTWSVSPSGIVTVNNGVVTPITNGSCTITVTCGSYSDTCSVTVSLPSVECTGITLDKTELALGVFSEKIDDSSVNYLDGVEWKDGQLNDSGQVINGADKYAEINVTLPGEYTFSTTNNYSYLKIYAICENDIAYGLTTQTINVFEPCTIRCSAYPNSLEWDSSSMSITRQNLSSYSSKDVNYELIESDIHVRYSNSGYSFVEVYLDKIYEIATINFNNNSYKCACKKSFNADEVAINNINSLLTKNLVSFGEYNNKTYLNITLPKSMGTTASEILANLDSTIVTINSSSLINEIESSVSQVKKLSDRLTATVTPTYCTQPVVWSVSPEGIVTVNNGLITAVTNGEATVTATCGTQSANCAVTVSGMSESGGGTPSTNPNLVFQVNSASMNTADNTLTDNIAGISATLTGNPTVSGNQIVFTANDKFSFDISSLNLTSSNRTVRIKFTPTTLDSRTKNVFLFGASKTDWASATSIYVTDAKLIMQHPNKNFNNCTVGATLGSANENRLPGIPTANTEYEIVISENIDGNIRWFVNGALVQDGTTTFHNPLYLANTEGTNRFIGSYSLIEVYNGYCNDYTEFTNMINSRNA